MTVLGSSDIIASIENLAGQNQPAQLLHFRDGKVLLLNTQGMALYQNHEAVHDELGNGLMAKTLFDEILPHNGHGEWVETYSAGFVGLYGDFALLITPAAIQLFPNKQDALYNRNELARLNLDAFI